MRYSAKEREQITYTLTNEMAHIIDNDRPISGKEKRRIRRKKERKNFK